MGLATEVRHQAYSVRHKLITIKLTVQYYRAVRLKSPKLKSIGLPTGIKI